jgi:uncharacterized UPF0160 family protein
MKTIVTHGANFHSDDLFAVAVLVHVLEAKGYSLTSKKPETKIKIIRTQDPEIISKGDYVVDIGGLHVPKKGRFDHHQQGGAGERTNGVPYASFGLVWKEYGTKLTGSQYAADWVDRHVVQGVDAMDSGMYVYTPHMSDVYPFLFIDYLSTACDVVKAGIMTSGAPSSNVAVGNARPSNKDFDKEFMRLLKVVHNVVSVFIIKSKQKEGVFKKARSVYQKSVDKRIMISDTFIPTQFEEFIAPEYIEPFVFVYPDLRGGWSAKVIQKESQSYAARMLFPVEWRGRRDAELEALTGEKGSRFCHNAGFLLVADTKETLLRILSKLII